jgi:hypothetical protein
MVSVHQFFDIILHNIFEDTAGWLTDGSAGPVDGCSDVALAI